MDRDPKGTGDRGSEPRETGPARRSTTPGRRPALTERQRREAREARRKRGRRPPKKERRPRGNPLVAGLRATGRELTRTFAFLGGLAIETLNALSPVGSALGRAVRQVVSAFGVVIRETVRAFVIAGKAISRLVERGDRIFTPARVTLAVSLGAALMLGWSQFIDYRAVEIGQPGYSGVLDVVSAPTTDARTPIDQHSFLLVAGALAALIASVTAARGRRRAGLVVAGAGLLAIVVALLVDLPAGTDASEVATAYSGAEPVLLAGFWLELAAGLGLVCCGALLATGPRAPRRRTARRRRRRPATAGGVG